MRKGILTIIGILLLNCLTLAQVLTDFESGNGGWARNPYRGEGVVTATVVADPTPRGEGNVLEIAYDGTAAGTTGSGQIQVDSYDFKSADIITFWVYVPAGFPDAAEIKPIGQDGWCWCDAANQTYKGVDIPKDTWYPLNYNIREVALAKPGSFSPYASGNYLAKLQLAVYTAGGATEEERNWAGKIYLDNVTAVGSTPYVDTDFESGLNGWGNTTDKGTGITAITVKADPTTRAKGNVLELAWDGSQAGTSMGGQIQKGNYDFKSSDVIAYWIYLPADFPDSYQIKPVGQDGWCWCDATNKTYNGSDIPKETWYPIYLNIREISIAKPGSFSPYASGNYLAKLQLRISNANATGTDVNWKGVVLVDDVSSLAPTVPTKWIVSTWDNRVKMLDGWFNDSGLGAAIDSIYRTTLDDANVLGAAFDFSKDNDGHFSKTGISLYDDSSATEATDLSVDVFLPSDIPSGKITWLVGAGSNLVAGETAISNIGKGAWKTVYFGNIAGITDKKTDVKVTIGVELDAASTYKGTVYFDNFTVWGIPEPANQFQSPDMQASLGVYEALNGVNYVITGGGGGGLDTFGRDWPHITKSVAAYHYSKVEINGKELAFKAIDLNGRTLDSFDISKTSTSVDENKTVPAEYSLEQNYPNPFNPSTKISFGLPVSSQVRIKVYSITGEVVADVLNTTMDAGHHEVEFDGSKLASGVYIYRIEAGSFIKERKMMLLK